MNQSAIESVLRKLIRETMGMPDNSVRPANQDAAVGTDPFATLLVTAIDEQTITGNQNFENIEDSDLIKETLKIHATASVSVQFFRGEAYAQATRLGARLRMSTAIEKMNKLNIGISRIGTARNLTALVDTYYENRGQIDLDFTLVVQQTADLLTFGIFRFDVSDESSTTSSEVIAP